MAYKAAKGVDLLPLEDAIGDIFEQADVVHIADTDHTSRKITDWLTKPEVLEELYARGARTLFLELPRGGDSVIQALAEGKLSPERFETAARAAGMKMVFGDSGRSFADFARLVVGASQAGLEVVFADGGNGSRELVAIQDFSEKAGLGRDYFGLTDRAEKVRRRAGVSKETLDEYDRLYDDFIRVRTDDRETVDFMKSRAEGKSIVLYGMAHDFRKDFAALGVSARKLSLFPNPQDWGKFLGTPGAKAFGDHVYILWPGYLLPVQEPDAPKPANGNTPKAG